MNDRDGTSAATTYNAQGSTQNLDELITRLDNLQSSVEAQILLTLSVQDEQRKRHSFVKFLSDATTAVFYGILLYMWTCADIFCIIYRLIMREYPTRILATRVAWLILGAILFTAIKLEGFVVVVVDVINEKTFTFPYERKLIPTFSSVFSSLFLSFCVFLLSCSLLLLLLITTFVDFCATLYENRLFVLFTASLGHFYLYATSRR